MPTRSEHDAVTRLLAEWSEGRDDAFNELFELVYEDLGRIARRHLREERGGHTLDTQALVHESYVRLVGKPGGRWRNRLHFYAVASTAMRRILIDYARRHRADKRGGTRVRVTLPNELAAPDRDLDELLSLEEGLRELAELDPRLVRIVECRFFGGLTAEETGHALALSLRTVEREWARARAHLYRHLRPDTDGSA
jgi:RNA polymerase sigma factor (TIGR02999 family)